MRRVGRRRPGANQQVSGGMGVSDEQVVGEEREIEGGEPSAHVHGRSERPGVLAWRGTDTVNVMFLSACTRPR